jgi:hypothetical protein
MPKPLPAWTPDTHPTARCLLPECTNVIAWPHGDKAGRAALFCDTAHKDSYRRRRRQLLKDIAELEPSVEEHPTTLGGRKTLRQMGFLRWHLARYPDLGPTPTKSAELDEGQPETADLADGTPDPAPGLSDRRLD